MDLYSGINLLLSTRTTTLTRPRLFVLSLNDRRWTLDFTWLFILSFCCSVLKRNVFRPFVENCLWFLHSHFFLSWTGFIVCPIIETPKVFSRIWNCALKNVFSVAFVCFWPSKSDADSRLSRQMWWGFVPFFLHKCLLLCDRSWSGCAEMPK